MTSKPYGDSAAVVLDDTAFASGSPRETSYARPGKLFTASSDLMMGQVGLRTPEARTRIVDAELALMRTDSPTASESNLGPDGKRLLARDIQTLHLNSARAMRLVSSGRGISPLSQTGPWAAHPALRDIRVSEINRLNRWPSTAAIPAQVSTPQDR
jgi:hypothetical protein